MWGSLCKPPYLPWDPSSSGSSAPSQQPPGAVAVRGPWGQHRPLVQSAQGRLSVQAGHFVILMCLWASG